MIAISLQSGSSGNCIYVETRGVRLLFDAGISGVQAAERLALHGRDIRAVDAVIISHDHGDHIRHAGVFHRKFGIPIYVTPATLAAAASRCTLGKLKDIRHFRSCDRLTFGEAVVHAVPTPHDGADGAVFVIEAGQKRLGIMTDLGHVFKDLIPLVSSLDAVFLESNYDPTMLADGPLSGLSEAAHKRTARAPVEPGSGRTAPPGGGSQAAQVGLSRPPVGAEQSPRYRAQDAPGRPGRQPYLIHGGPVPGFGHFRGLAGC